MSAFCGSTSHHVGGSAEVIGARSSEIFREAATRLGDLAQLALARGHRAADILIVCIVVDSSWRPLVDALLPGHDWQAARDRGEIPVCQGSVPRQGTVDRLCEVVPEIAPALRQSPPPGQLHVVVCVEGGASLFVVTPRSEPC